MRDAPFFVWVTQEMIKGTFLQRPLRRVEAHGGWGFNRAYIGTDGHVTQFPLPAHRANELDPWGLTNQPFFLPFANAALFDEDGGDVATDPAVLAKHLAEALPAMSRAAGANPLVGFGNQDMQEFNDTTPWPAERAADRAWRHNDMRDVAYFYTFRLYNDLVITGSLR